MIKQSLTGSSWQFRECGQSPEWLPATVPGCVHKDLLRQKRIPDPFWGANELQLQWIEERDWEYRLQFTATDALLREEVQELVAEGVDTVARVFLNGREVGRTDNMFTGYRWDIAAMLRKGKNELRVIFTSALKYIRANQSRFKAPVEFSDPVGGHTLLRKQPCQFGWDWGPRLVTCGVWLPIYIEAWSGNRIEHVRVSQNHYSNHDVSLVLKPEMQRAERGLVFKVSVSIDGCEVAAAETLFGNGAFEVPVSDPQLWWPAGLGGQPLYDVTVTAHSPSGAPRGEWKRRIGLRTLALERKPDQWGESFRFVVNGKPVFMKGANWIPTDSFVAGLDRERYARDVRAAAAANFNCLRVWGGGIYESEHFYDLCDELGLMVWQDFMFACTLPPGDAPFLKNVEIEARHQVRRLHHRACVALFCGNNEMVQTNGALQKPKYRRPYEKLFHKLLPKVVREESGFDYWPTSQWRGDWKYGNSDEAGEQRGDTHYWAVWHGRNPVKDYEKWKFRFVAEYGMQSFSSPKVQATYCPPDDNNVFGPIVENHQKNRAGNQIILDYVSRRYRFPKNQDALIYLSQLNQAYSMQVAVEHHRRLAPRCMGTIYWQLNDCWPVASWSSIEYTGNWKTLHHYARRFFAPALVTAHVPGDEYTVNGNYRRTTVDKVHVHTVCDAVEKQNATVVWELHHIDGRMLDSGRKNAVLRYGESKRQHTLDMHEPMQTHGRDNLIIRLSLMIDGARVSENTVFLTPPRFIPLQKANTRVQVKRLGSDNRFALTFASDVFQHCFQFDLAGMDYSASDNCFDLYAKQPRTVEITLNKPAQATVAEVTKALGFYSLVDSYK